MKSGIYWLLLTLIAVALFVILKQEKKVYLAGKTLPVLSQFEGTDWRGEKSWGLTASVEGKEKAFEVYPGVFNALIHDSVVMINLAEIDDQFGGESDRVTFKHLGKTKEELHLFYIFNRSKWASHLLFVEFEKNQGASLHDLINGKSHIFYEDQVLVRKVGTIPLGECIFLPDDFDLEENLLRIGARTFDLRLQPPSLPELVTGKFPYGFNQKPFISPLLVDGFTECMRTGYSSLVSVDLTEAQNNPAYCFLGNGFTNDTERNCKYDYEGMAANGVHIVHTFNTSTRPPRSRHLLFLYEKDYELRVDWEKKTITRDKSRLLLKKVGELDLYLAEPFALSGNTVSYTNMEWENKPYAITGTVERIDTSIQIGLTTY